MGCEVENSRIVLYCYLGNSYRYSTKTTKMPLRSLGK